jgi:hypothetical protein
LTVRALSGLIGLSALSCSEESQQLSVYGLEERYALRAEVSSSDCEVSGARLSAAEASAALTVSALGEFIYLALEGEAEPLTATLCRDPAGEPVRLCLYGERVSGFAPSLASGVGGQQVSRCEARVSLEAREAPSAARCCEGPWESALEVTRAEDGRTSLRGALRGALQTRALSASGEELTDEESATRCGVAGACGFTVRLEATPE